MTRDEFISNTIALVGGGQGWQTRIAHALDIDPRTIRRAIKDGPSEGVARALKELLGETAPQAVHAEWIIGEGNDGREYLIHTRIPRFRCLIVAEGDDYDLEDDNGVQYAFGDQTLAGFHWIDPMPSDLARWMERVADFLDCMTN